MKLIGLSFVALVFFVGGCSSLILKPADFAWPVESKLTVGPDGMAKESRYSIAFNAKPLIYSESRDTSNVDGQTLWIIRDTKGFYYITGPGFKDVYIFEQGSGGLKLKKEILVSKTGIASPAFNQRNPYIELLNGDSKPIMLTENGISKEAEK